MENSKIKQTEWRQIKSYNTRTCKQSHRRNDSYSRLEKITAGLENNRACGLEVIYVEKKVQYQNDYILK